MEKQAAVLEEKGLFAEAGDTWGQLLAFEKESAQLHKRNKRKKKSYRAPLPTGKNSDKVSLSQKCARNMCTCYFRAEEWEKAADTCDKAGRYGHKADSLEDVNNIVNVHLNAAEALINLGKTCRETRLRASFHAISLFSDRIVRV